MRKSKAVVLVLSLLTSTLMLGQVNYGSPALELPIDARSGGLGFKLTADLNPNSYGALYNAALADSIDIGYVNMSYINYLAGVQGGGINSIVRASNKYALQVGARFLSFGEFSGYDPSGVATNNFSGGDYFIQGGLSYKLDSSITGGLNLWGGFRNLATENVGSIGFDVSLMKRWDDKLMAAGVLVSGVGVQFASTGSQPTGSTPVNIQAGITKGFNHAPFVFFLNLQNLQTWDLAPDGTYDDTLDPLTGEVIPNKKWKFGDQLARHLNFGVELSFGTNFKAQIGYDHRRRAEMIANGLQGMNGISFGLGMKVKDLDVKFARNTYHFAGGSTHLSIGINLPR